MIDDSQVDFGPEPPLPMALGEILQRLLDPVRLSFESMARGMGKTATIVNALREELVKVQPKER